MEILQARSSSIKEEGKHLHGHLICTYTLSEYISGIYVDGLCIISVKINFEKSSIVTYWCMMTSLVGLTLWTWPVLIVKKRFPQAEEVFHNLTLLSRHLLAWTITTTQTQSLLGPTMGSRDCSHLLNNCRYLTANGKTNVDILVKVICISWSNAVNTRNIFTTEHRGVTSHSLRNQSNPRRHRALIHSK